jgi:hypothetical protein
MPTEPKFFWKPPNTPLTSEERKFIAEHERLHVRFAKDVSDEDRALMFKQIEQFEGGSPFVHPVPNWRELAVDHVDLAAMTVRNPSSKKYFVHWGYMHRHVEEFTDFQRAIDHLVDHKGGPDGARLVGEGYDADCDEDGLHEVSDGLTDWERERVEEVS